MACMMGPRRRNAARTDGGWEVWVNGKYFLSSGKAMSIVGHGLRRELIFQQVAA